MSEWMLSDEWIETFNDNRAGGVEPAGDPAVVLGLVVAEAPPATGPSVYIEMYTGSTMWATRMAPPAGFATSTAPLEVYSDFTTAPLRDILGAWNSAGANVKVEATPGQMTAVIGLMAGS